jgi:hypothetical protein
MWENPIPVACVFGLRFVEIAGSNPAGAMDVCLLWMLCAVQVEASETGRSLIQGSQTESVCASECDQAQQ